MSAPHEIDRLRALAGDGSDGWSTQREKSFVEGVLGKTTRSLAHETDAGVAQAAQARPSPRQRAAGRDPSDTAPGWRGDLGLVARFVGQRLRDSRALRMAAAASLLLHVAAVPALAWWLLAEEPTPRPLLIFELPEDQLPDWPLDELVEPERPLDSPQLDGLLDPDASAAVLAARENALRRSRYVLDHWFSDVELGSALVGRPETELEWLALRLAGQRADWIRALDESYWRQAQGRSRYLAADWLLDALALDLEVPEDWRGWLAELAADHERGRSGADAADEPYEAMARWTLARARSYGYLPLDGHDGRDGLERLESPDREAGHPFPSAWLELARSRVAAQAPGSAVEPVLAALDQLRKRSASRP